MTEDQESSNSGNVFTGNVGSLSSSPSSSFSITPEDPNRFIWSQFFIGLLLIPIFAGFMVALTTIISEDAVNDAYYDDYQWFYSDYDPGSIIISGAEYNTWEVVFDIPDIDIYEIENKDYWFDTRMFLEHSANSWGYCFFNMDMQSTMAESSDGNLWYSMECRGSLENNDAYLLISNQTFIYATDSDERISEVSVSGDSDTSIDSIFMSILPILIPILYLIILIWSFVKKNKSLGFGLLGGIIVAPVSFCFSFIFLGFMFIDNW